MKKAVVIGAVLGITILALGVVGFAYAQNQFPINPSFQGDADETYPYGYGMMGRGGLYNGTAGRGFVGPMMEGDEHGPLHEYMMESLAGALGINASELEERHEAGEILWDIAQEQGISPENFRDLMLKARNDAINQAVADEVISQDQADWMLEHMGQGFGLGNGECHGDFGPGAYGPGMHGQGGRWNSRP